LVAWTKVIMNINNLPQEILIKIFLNVETASWLTDLQYFSTQSYIISWHAFLYVKRIKTLTQLKNLWLMFYHIVKDWSTSPYIVQIFKVPSRPPVPKVPSWPLCKICQNWSWKCSNGKHLAPTTLVTLKRCLIMFRRATRLWKSWRYTLECSKISIIENLNWRSTNYWKAIWRCWVSGCNSWNWKEIKVTMET